MTWILILLILISVLAAAVCFYFARVACLRVDIPEKHLIQYELEQNRVDKQVLELPYELWERSNPRGERIVARFIKGKDSGSKRIILVNHGYHATWLSMCKYLPMLLELGFSVLLPDHRCHGDSDGKYITYGALESDDCVDWLKEIQKRYPQARLSVLGESMGAATTLLIAEKFPELEFAVADCPYDSCENVLAYTGKRRYHFPMVLMPLVKLGFRLLTGVSIDEASPIAGLHELKVPTLLVHGDADKTVPVSMGRRMAQQSEYITYWEVKGQPHAHVVVDHAEEYKEKIAELMARAEVKM